MVRDPYARWCGRGGAARCPPIPITDPEPTFVSSPADRWVYRGAVVRTTRISSSRQLIEQRLRFFQIGGVEALGEPAVNGCQEIARFAPKRLRANLSVFILPHDGCLFWGIFTHTTRRQPSTVKRRFETFPPLPRNGEVRP